MYDISFIIPCDDSSTEIDQTIKCLSTILEYSSAIEIIVINNSINNCYISSQILEYEERYPENILIVNLDTGYETGSLMEIGLNYSDSFCYIFMDFPLDYICVDMFEKLQANRDICDLDRFKYIKDKYTYIALGSDQSSFRFEQNNEIQILTDYRADAGSIDRHYFFQDIYVANKILKHGHKHIYDIGSRVEGYISHLLAMDIGVTMIDIRPLSVNVDNLSFVEGNATNLSGLDAGIIPALSCLHALEHFGLGRYGDPIDFFGWRKALNAFKRVVALDGYLYLSVPIGKHETVMFNAHRIFHPKTILHNLSPTFTLLEFTLLHDGNRTTFDFSQSSSQDIYEEIFNEISNNLIGDYDCGIYVFQKK